MGKGIKRLNKGDYNMSNCDCVAPSKAHPEYCQKEAHFWDYTDSYIKSHPHAVEELFYKKTTTENKQFAKEIPQTMYKSLEESEEKLNLVVAATGVGKACTINARAVSFIMDEDHHFNGKWAIVVTEDKELIDKQSGSYGCNKNNHILYITYASLPTFKFSKYGIDKKDVAYVCFDEAHSTKTSIRGPFAKDLKDLCLYNGGSVDGFTATPFRMTDKRNIYDFFNENESFNCNIYEAIEQGGYEDIPDVYTPAYSARLAKQINDVRNYCYSREVPENVRKELLQKLNELKANEPNRLSIQEARDEAAAAALKGKSCAKVIIQGNPDTKASKEGTTYIPLAPEIVDQIEMVDGEYKIKNLESDFKFEIIKENAHGLHGYYFKSNSEQERIVASNMTSILRNANGKKVRLMTFTAQNKNENINAFLAEKAPEGQIDVVYSIKKFITGHHLDHLDYIIKEFKTTSNQSEFQAFGRATGSKHPPVMFDLYGCDRNLHSVNLCKIKNILKGEQSIYRADKIHAPADSRWDVINEVETVLSKHIPNYNRYQVNGSFWSFDEIRDKLDIEDRDQEKALRKLLNMHKGRDIDILEIIDNLQ